MESVEGLVAVGATRTLIEGDAGSAAESFARHRAIAFAAFLDRPFLEMLLKRCGRSTFVRESVEGIGFREVETPSRAGAAITLALRRPNLHRWLEAVTGCGPLRSVSGCVVLERAGSGDELTWHNDLNFPGRRLALTVNLTEQAYEGGEFELRAHRTGEPLVRHRHAAPGSALLFEVARGLEHRVLPVRSGGPRCVYAGWFSKDDA